MQFPDDPVAFEVRARLEQRRRRQFGRACEDFAGLAIGHVVEANDLDREIILTAVLQCFVDDGPRRLAQVLRMIVNRLGGKAGADVLVRAIGRQQEHVSLFDL
jgi:hypothetical protein